MNSNNKKQKSGIWQTILGQSNKISKNINIIGLFALGVLSLGMITNKAEPETSKYIENEVDTEFSCLLTEYNNLQQPDIGELKTMTQIGTINYEKDVFHSQYSKGEIPAITKPIYSTFSEISKCTHDHEDVVIVTLNNDTYVYPKRILSQHLVINTKINKIPILISYSNLSGSYKVYNRSYKNEPLTFGVSGKIYKNNDLLYDYKTESLWSQLDGIAKIGSLTDAKLKEIPFQITTFGYAQENYPNAKVLSYQTGFIKSYNIVDYGDFSKHNQILQTITTYDDSLDIKEKVLTFKLDDDIYAIPKSAILNNSSKTIKQNGQIMTIYNENNTFYMLDSNLNKLQIWHSLWYSWYDFYPTTKLINNR